MAEGTYAFLYDAAASLNEYVRDEPKTEPRPAGPAPVEDELRPGDDYNRRAGWKDILGRHGWQAVWETGETTYWRRPGKQGRAWSATTGHCKSERRGELLYVFSSNAAPFEPEHTYSKFEAYALLHHAGDFAAAARQLRQEGYGSESKPTGVTLVRGGEGEPGAAEVVDDPQVATIHDLIARGAEVQWIWEGWIARGVLTAIAAEGGTGKTRLCADLLRRVRQQIPWPDGQAMTLPADSLALWVVADNHHDEMVTLSRSFDIVDGIRINAWAHDPYGGVSLDEPDDLQQLERRIQLVQPAFVIVDTVGNATDRNLSRQEEAKAFYFPLQVLARRYRCAVLCLTHLNAGGKFLGRRVLEKVRVALKMEKPCPGDQRRALSVEKTNSKKPNPLGVTMGDAGNEYDFTPPEAPATEPGTGVSIKPSPVTEAAVAWLRAWLRDGPKAVGNTRTASEQVPISPGTLYTAMRLLKVEEYEMQNRKWWRLKEDTAEI